MTILRQPFCIMHFALCISLASIFAVPSISARTLEFWSMEAGATPGTLDLSPTIDASHVLQAYSASGAFSLCMPAFRGVPGNQSFTTERNTSAISTFDALRSVYCNSDDLRTAAMLGNDFTFEGWFKFSTANNFWLFGTRSSKGWYLKFTTTAGFTFYCGSEYALLSSGDIARMRNEWTHVAFVWHHDGGDNGYGYCELFLDWELVATKSMTAAPTTTAKDLFYIGGRGNGGEDFKGGRFAVDCVRFSDTALTSAEFLRAGDSPADTYTASANPDVVGFWRLDSGAVYTNVVPGGINMAASNKNTAWMDDSAVTRIPNMEWSTWPAGGDNYDHGSVRLDTSYASGNRLYVSGGAAGVSKYLSLTNDFTVEMWLKVPRELPSSWAILTGVHTTSSPRWWVTIKNNVYRTMVQGSSYAIADNSTFTNGTEVCTLTTDDVGKWRHHAIVFEKDKGAYGTFSIYIDGIYRGSRAFTAAYSAANSESLAGYTFDIGGRDGANCFNGLGVDLVRVSKRALLPSEFLNAESSYHPPAAAAVTNMVVETKTAALVTNALDEACYVTCDRPFTVEGWVRIDTEAAYPQKLAECKAGSGGWTLTATNRSEMLLSVTNGDGETIAEKSFALPKDDFTWWKHLEMTYNFGLWNIYVSKEFVGSVTDTVSFAGTDSLPVMTLGTDAGKVDHMKWRIVNNALSAEDFDGADGPMRGFIIVVQ